MNDRTNPNGNELPASSSDQETKHNTKILKDAEKFSNNLIHWTEFPDKFSTTKKEFAGTWADLIERLQTAGKFPSKASCPWIKIATFGVKRTKDKSLRSNENVQFVYGVEGDYDGEMISIAAAKAKLESFGIRAAFYPSPSSTIEKPRWRVICPLSAPHKPDARYALVARLNGALGGILSGESFTLSQSYYYGVLPTNDYRILVSFDDPDAGNCIDTLDELVDIAIGKSKPRKKRAKREDADQFDEFINPETIRDLRSALGALRADDRDLWVSIGHALKTLGDQGRALWLEWSQTSEKYDPEDASTKWEGFVPTSTGYKSVFAKAQAAGWANPRANETPRPEDIQWSEIADPFAEYVVPAFPVDALPESFATLCRELSAQSGFDVGGYAFALLVTASSLIDQRAKMKAGPLCVPAFLWGGLVANSGGGKSPTIKGVMGKVVAINDELVKESSREMAQWNIQFEMSTRGPKPPKPKWRQFIANDITVEGLGQLLHDNPSGLLLAHDELTEFIGRMDAYSGNGAGSKDRGVYLRAFDGGSSTINRGTKPPLVIENFSVGIVTGIQPEKLGELFKKSGGGADGLYQRFLVYAMQPAGAVNYLQNLGAMTQANADRLLQALHDRTEKSDYENFTLCTEALPLMQEYHQQARTMAQRTRAKRLAEHFDKFPGFLARIIFTLHCLECAEHGCAVNIVSIGTFQKAKQIMKCLYHHSVAVYEVLDSQAGEVSRLTKSACEAILSKNWGQVSRGDLTRHATDWRNADDRMSSSAIDCLIELGWLHDVTPATEPGKRGRRSCGLFVVNPLVHQRFLKHAERIKTDRALRWAALKEMAAQRGGKQDSE